jgi:hypothetical protein
LENIAKVQLVCAVRSVEATACTMGVTVFHRIEDDEMITQTVVTGPSATVEAVPNARTTNPSSRRDSIEIEFQCELCRWKNSDLANQRMFLRIAQHKGKTLLEWRFEGREAM